MIKKLTSIKATRLVLVVAGLTLVIAGIMLLSSKFMNDPLLSDISLWKGKPPVPHWLGKFQSFGIVTLVNGVMLVAFNWLVLFRWTFLKYLASKERYVLVGAIFTLIILWLPSVLILKSATIAGERYWWLWDDVMISMRFARNLANGIGLVWNAGERVEGYTNFLWTIYMALIHLFPISASKISIVILLTNVMLAILTIPVIIRIVHTLGGGVLATISSLAGYVLSKNTMIWAVQGSETTLLTFLFLLAMYRVLRESQLNQPKPATYLLIAIMSLVRADSIILSCLLYGLSFLLTKKKMVIFYSGISLILPFVHELFRLYYYGDILPNTAYLKTSSWDGRYIVGIRYVLSFARNYAFIIVFAIIGSLRSFRLSHRALLAVFLMYVAFVLYIGGDAFPDYRFFVPVLPLLMILAFVGIQSLGFQQTLRLAIVILCLDTMPLNIFNYTSTFHSEQNNDGNIRIGLLLKQNTPVTSKVADSWAGSVFYFSERYAIDFLGKSDRYISHLPVGHKGTIPGHNKFDYNYSIGVLKPDFIVANFRLPVREEEMSQAATGNYAFTGQLYYNPVFREHCLPYPVTVETWRTIFVCNWSNLIEQRNDWRNVD
jgi:hypothetical protein